MRWIYLSPHLDDAVFSAGGLIYEQTQSGIPVEVWTFMCGYPPLPEDDLSPFAQLLHVQWGYSSAEEAIRLRREEDRKAAAIVGANTVHFDFLDCIYRRGANGEWLYSDVSVPPHPEDASFPSQIGETISARLKPDDVLVCQLGVGSHVDHVLVRQGAELLGHPLLYDIDVPYILYKPNELEAKSIGMKESVQAVMESSLIPWREAALMYKSQLVGLGELFDSSESIQVSLQSYWAERRGIRLLQMD
ncbi:MAG TPA: PIG-L family deacetylase [Anaerolineales bacterium]|nr:PIG-L family deacetylase [Anaerolineales bacterium]